MSNYQWGKNERSQLTNDWPAFFWSEAMAKCDKRDPE
jgi:hypothetical protein